MNTASKVTLSLFVCVLPLILTDLPSGRERKFCHLAAPSPRASLQIRRPPAQQTQATAPPQPELVELHADLVTVTATVVSLSGQPVPELTAHDFEIQEDGVPQSIMTFSRHEHLPLSLVMLVDGSLSMKPRLNFQKEVLARFLRTIVRPIDRVAIVRVGTDVVWQQPFTADLGRLLSAIGRLNAEGATALYDAVQSAADTLTWAAGRRVIVILSDGRDTISRTTLSAALERLQQADVVVYAINTSGRSVSANLRELAGERALERLCTQTGGQVFFPDRLDELDSVLVRLAEQLRTQYVLGYVSTNDVRDGSYRRLTVRVNRPHLLVRARDGYYALTQ